MKGFGMAPLVIPFYAYGLESSRSKCWIVSEDKGIEAFFWGVFGHGIEDSASILWRSLRATSCFGTFSEKGRIVRRTHSDGV